MSVGDSKRITQERREAIRMMWKNGWSVSVIATALGWTITRTDVEVARMRNLGWDLPHRYPARRIAASKRERKEAKRSREQAEPL